MKLKETTIDQRLMAGLLSIIVLGYGIVVVERSATSSSNFAPYRSRPYRN